MGVWLVTTKNAQKTLAGHGSLQRRSHDHGRQGGLIPCGWQIFAFLWEKRLRKPMVKPLIFHGKIYLSIYMCVCVFGRFSLKPIHGFEILSISQTSGQHPYWRLTSAGLSFFLGGGSTTIGFSPTCPSHAKRVERILLQRSRAPHWNVNSHSLVRPTVDGCEILHQFIGGLSHC